MHLAAKIATADVIRKLLAAYPKGAKEKDAAERLPLYYATRASASAEVIDILLNVTPDWLDAGSN